MPVDPTKKARVEDTVDELMAIFDGEIATVRPGTSDERMDITRENLTELVNEFDKQSIQLRHDNVDIKQAIQREMEDGLSESYNWGEWCFGEEWEEAGERWHAENPSCIADDGTQLYKEDGSWSTSPRGGDIREYFSDHFYDIMKRKYFDYYINDILSRHDSR